MKGVCHATFGSSKIKAEGKQAAKFPAEEFVSDLILLIGKTDAF